MIFGADGNDSSHNVERKNWRPEALQPSWFLDVHRSVIRVLEPLGFFLDSQTCHLNIPTWLPFSMSMFRRSPSVLIFGFLQNGKIWPLQHIMTFRPHDTVSAIKLWFRNMTKASRFQATKWLNCNRINHRLPFNLGFARWERLRPGFQHVTWWWLPLFPTANQHWRNSRAASYHP